MQIAHEIFKAYDIRGIVDQSLTVEITRLIGQALRVNCNRSRHANDGGWGAMAACQARS